MPLFASARQLGKNLRFFPQWVFLGIKLSSDISFSSSKHRRNGKMLSFCARHLATAHSWLIYECLSLSNCKRLKSDMLGTKACQFLTCQEWLSEIKSWDPEHVWHSMVYPGLEERQSVKRKWKSSKRLHYPIIHFKGEQHLRAVKGQEVKY